MNSCLYPCRVMHHRLQPKKHRFNYQIFFCAFDLDELDGLDKRIGVFSRNRWNLYAFYDRDHLILPSRENDTVRDKLRHYLAENQITLPPEALITLVTLPRIFGYIFNPVSFYFCCDTQNQPLCAVVEVRNTFGEMKLYLLPALAGDNRFSAIVPKNFYVSPFSALEICFDFQLTLPNEKLKIRINDLEDGRPILLSAVDGTRRPFTQTQLLKYSVLYPLLTVQVIFFIHWEAFLLWAKGIAWFRKSAQPEQQTQVLRPHVTLTKQPL